MKEAGLANCVEEKDGNIWRGCTWWWKHLPLKETSRNVLWQIYINSNIPNTENENLEYVQFLITRDTGV